MGDDSSYGGILSYEALDVSHTEIVSTEESRVLPLVYALFQQTPSQNLVP